MAENYSYINLQNKIHIEKVDEILGAVPPSISYMGVITVCSILLIAVAMSWVIHYPEMITAEIIITSENPPAPVLACTTGTIKQILVRDHQRVISGEILGVIDSTTDYCHVLELQKYLKTYTSGLTASHADKLPQYFDKKYSLGPLQHYFSNFLLVYSEYQFFINLHKHERKIKNLNSELQKWKYNLIQLQHNQELFNEELTRFWALTIFQRGEISNLEPNILQNSSLQLRQIVEKLKLIQIKELSRIQQIELDMLNYEQRHDELEQQHRLILRKVLDDLLSQLAIWEDHYIVRSPIKGTVTFIKNRNDNQDIQPGETIMIVIPENSGPQIGKIYVPSSSSGKVKIGQKVNIKLQNYPCQEYGIVIGRVKSKSYSIANDSYVFDIDLPYGLTTTYEKKLEFKQQMHGTGEIITDDLRLLERILGTIKKSWGSVNS